MSDVLKKKEHRRCELIEAYKRVFGSADGKKVLTDLLIACHEGRDTFVAGAPDLSAWNQGQRAVGLYIKTKLKLDTKKIMALLKEHEQERLANDYE